jgi:small conductance mechanosensitive channel
MEKDSKTQEKGKTQEKSKKMKASTVVKIVLIVLAIAYLAVGFIVPNEIFRKNIKDVANIGGRIVERGPTILRSITIVIVIVLISLLIQLVLKLLFSGTTRGKTLIKIINSFIKYAAVLGCIFAVLSAFGVDTTTLLAGAGILALMISLGTQSLVADIVAGLFINFENVFEIGDIVTIDGFRGEVFEVGIRNTKLRDISGNVKIIKNSAISNIVNMSHELSLVTAEISIAGSSTVEEVEQVINDSLAAIGEKIPAIKEGPYYKGITSFNDEGCGVKIVAYVNEADRFQTERDLKRELKRAFNKGGIKGVSA